MFVIRVGIVALACCGVHPCACAWAASGQNAYVTVSCAAAGTEDVVPKGADFYVTTRGVDAANFCADIEVKAHSPYYLVSPEDGRLRCRIGGGGGYEVRDESGTEDSFSGSVEVLKLDIEPEETNICWKSTSCTLKLTRDSHPGGAAVWLSSPAGISGQGNSVTFNPNALLPGVYTVTARSGAVEDYKDTCIVRIYGLLSETVASIPSDRTRTVLGVGEEVNVALVPLESQAKWSISGGAGEISPDCGYAVCVKAPASATVFDVQCSIKELTLVLRFSVVEPTGVMKATFHKEVDIPMGVSGAGMQLYPVYVAPTNVSFYNVKCMEVGMDAIRATGYWTIHPPPSHIGNGADIWFPLDYANQWPADWDYAGVYGIAPPWLGGGTYEWPIPAKWTVNGSKIEKSMTGWNQKIELMSDGTVTVRKLGVWITRTVKGISTHGGNGE